MCGLWNDFFFLLLWYCLLIGAINTDKVGQNENSILFAQFERCERNVHKPISEWFLLLLICVRLLIIPSMYVSLINWIYLLRINLKIVSAYDERVDKAEEILSWSTCSILKSKVKTYRRIFESNVRNIK